MSFPSGLVVRHPWVFIALFSLVTLLFGTQLPKLEIDPEIKNQLPEDMPARQNARAVEARFGGSELIMVVLTAPDVTEPAVLERLQALSEGLEAIESVDQVLGLFTLQSIRGDDGMMLVERAVDEIPDTPEAQEALKGQLAANPLVYGNVVSQDFTAAATIALLAPRTSDADTIEAVEGLIARTPGPGEVVIGGMPNVRTQVSRDIDSDMQRFMPLGLLIIVGFLYACFRELRGVILPMLVVVMATVVAMGLIPLFGWKVQMVTVLLPVILLAVSNDYGIHLVARYQEANVPGGPRDARSLASQVVQDLGAPVTAAALTTVAGLLSLTTHIVVPAAQLGVLAAIGVGWALLCSLFFVPAVLAVLPVPPPIPSMVDAEKRGLLDRVLAAMSRLVTGRPGLVLAVSLGVAALSAGGIALLKVDTNPVNYYAANAPVARTSQLMNDSFGGSTELAVMIGGDIQDPDVLRRIDGLERALGDLPDVGYTASVARVVRMMNQALMGGGPEHDVLPESREAVAQYFLLYGMGGDPSDFERIVDFEYEHALLTARINSLSTRDIAEVVQVAEQHVAAELADLDVVIGGFGPVFSDLVGAIVDGQITSLALSLGIVLVLVAFVFRSLPAGIYATVPLLVAMPVLFGLMGYLSIELNVVTAMLSSIMIGVGVDYTIHFLWRYREERRAGLEAPEAVQRTLTTAGRGIVFNALSVIAGFAVLLISNFMPVKYFGFLVVVSLGACLLGGLVLLPSLLLVVRPAFTEPEAAADPRVAA